MRYPCWDSRRNLLCIPGAAGFHHGRVWSDSKEEMYLIETSWFPSRLSTSGRPGRAVSTVHQSWFCANSSWPVYWVWVATKKPETIERTGRLSKEGTPGHAFWCTVESFWGGYPKVEWRCDLAPRWLGTTGAASGDQLSLLLRLLHNSGFALRVNH